MKSTKSSVKYIEFANYYYTWYLPDAFTLLLVRLTHIICASHISIILSFQHEFQTENLWLIVLPIEIDGKKIRTSFDSSVFLLSLFCEESVFGDFDPSDWSVDDLSVAFSFFGSFSCIGCDEKKSEKLIWSIETYMMKCIHMKTI